MFHLALVPKYAGIVGRIAIIRQGIQKKWKLYSDFELQGIEEEKLNSKVYQTVCSRLQLEEAAASVSDANSREKDDSEASKRGKSLQVNTAISESG
ncbi:hypothetical protein HPB51_013632 [Rhipicephalus microplus]|uniref:Uncharacterized protein n=1 Tax=Rhipicephalus microplus TaxID=6941 RepID=A0A9J6EA45_RHIMP|nr:hypothetical protein HPB51_013632 [Rhipicephalus microplus]